MEQGEDVSVGEMQRAEVEPAGDGDRGSAACSQAAPLGRLSLPSQGPPFLSDHFLLPDLIIYARLELCPVAAPEYNFREALASLAVVPILFYPENKHTFNFPLLFFASHSLFGYHFCPYHTTG